MRGHAVYIVTYAYSRLHIQRERHSLTRRVTLHDTFLSIRYATAIRLFAWTRAIWRQSPSMEYNGIAMVCIATVCGSSPGWSLRMYQSQISNQAAPALWHGCMWSAAHSQVQHRAMTCLHVQVQHRAVAWLHVHGALVAGGCVTNMSPWDYSGSNREAIATLHRALATSAACHTPGRHHQTRCSRICHRGRLTLA